MFIKNNSDNFVISLLALNLVYFVLGNYLPASIKDIILLPFFLLNLAVFIGIVATYFRYKKYRKKVAEKLKKFKESKHIDTEVRDYKALYKLVSQIERTIVSKQEKREFLEDENFMLRNKLSVTENLLNQKIEKLSKIYANLKIQMEKTSVYGKEIAKIESIKENIIAIISHEIRSPLFASINYFDVLKSTMYPELDDTYRQIFDKVQEGLYKMNDTVTEMIDIHKLDTDEYEVKYEKRDFVSFVEKLVHNFERRTEGNRDLTFIIDIKIQKAEAIFDRAIMKKIIDNLLSNACRFTPDEGTVTLSLDITHRKNRSYFFISISDTGIGVEKTNLYRIFAKFYETEAVGHTVLNHKSGKLEFGTKGLGVGLPIVKELVKLHGGELWVESEGKNKGTSFNILIPNIEK